MESQVPVTQQLMDLYGTNGTANIAVNEVPEADIEKYGIIDVEQENSEDAFSVRNFVEKSNPQAAPSQLAIAGRYVLTPEIFENQEPSKDDEVQLTDAIGKLNETQRVFTKKTRSQTL